MKILLVLTVFCFGACMDYHSDIALIKNNTASGILVGYQPYERMNDSILYNERFSETYVGVKQSHFVSLPNMRLSSQPDSAMCYMYLFNDDSEHKYQTSHKMVGILKSAFIKRIDIHLNKVKDPIDTILVK